LATGAQDGSIALWSLLGLGAAAGSVASSFTREQRGMRQLAAMAGHRGSVLALALCPELGLLVSGGLDGQTMVWDLRSARLVRVLPPHQASAHEDRAKAVVSVSVGAQSGRIAVLGECTLRLFSVNGALLASEDLRSSTAVPLPAARVVLMPPLGDWQDGVVAVTGHDQGQVHLWRLQPSSSSSSPRRLRLSLAQTLLPKSHSKRITALRLCPAHGNGPPPRRELISRSFEDPACLELVVGDCEGWVSRWTALRLDALGEEDSQAVAAELAVEAAAKNAALQDLTFRESSASVSSNS